MSHFGGTLYSDMRKTCRNFSVLTALTALGASCLVGCSQAGPVWQRPAEQSLAQSVARWSGAAPEGARSELVFHSPTTSDAQVAMGISSDPSRFAEFSRRDESLNPRPNQPLLATRSWPEPDRPDLYYARRVWLETDARQLLYFERSGGQSSGFNRQLYRSYDGFGARSGWSY